MRALVGRRVQVRVLEADPKRDRLILSEKAAMQQLRRDRKARGTTQLSEGDVLAGVVVGVTSYGLFVDVGVADGLVHRSEITWEKGVNQLDTGQTVEATVTRVMPYGAFARVADGVEGLIHVSELGRERVADPHEVVRVGEVLLVRIVAVDRERRRLSLSARLAERT